MTDMTAREAVEVLHKIRRRIRGYMDAEYLAMDDSGKVGLGQRFDEALSALADRAGWQPIETAPKDGTSILLCSIGGMPWQGHWRRAGDYRAHIDGEGWTRTNSCDVGWNPDVWMPLPPPAAPGASHD